MPILTENIDCDTLPANTWLDRIWRIQELVPVAASSEGLVELFKLLTEVSLRVSTLTSYANNARKRLFRAEDALRDMDVRIENAINRHEREMHENQINQPSTLLSEQPIPEPGFPHEAMNSKFCLVDLVNSPASLIDGLLAVAQSAPRPKQARPNQGYFDWLTHHHPLYWRGRLIKQNPDLHYSTKLKCLVCDLRKFNPDPSSTYTPPFSFRRQPHDFNSQVFSPQKPMRQKRHFVNGKLVQNPPKPRKNNPKPPKKNSYQDMKSSGVYRPVRLTAQAAVCTLCDDESSHYITTCKNLVWSPRQGDHSEELKKYNQTCPPHRFCYAHSGNGQFCKGRGHYSHFCPNYAYTVKKTNKK